jgi:hypothetical protein
LARAPTATATAAKAAPGSTLGRVSLSPASQGDKAYDPGVPSIKELWPSIVFGALVPLGVYYLVRSHVHSDAQALIIAGCFPVAWIVFGIVRTRQFDIIGGIVLFGFAVGVITSTLLGGNAYVLKVRDSVFTAIFGLACIVSIFHKGRPIIFFVGRYLSAGNDPEKKAAFDELHELPTGRRTFRVLTVVWGISLLIEAGCRLVLAEALSTKVFLAVSPVISGVTIGGAFVFTVVYSNRSRERAAAMLADPGETETSPPIPLT